MPGHRNLIISAVICVCAFTAHTQTSTARIMIESGGSVRFNINSLIKYNDGMALEDWTRLAIAFEDTLDATATWKLQFRSNTDMIYGDYGQELPLNYLVLEARDGGGSTLLGEEGNGLILPAQSLDITEKTLIENAPQGTFQDNKLYISFSLGQGEDKLIGQPSDYYYVDIEFILTPNN
ncbi:MAG: hypothetical protein ACLFQA_11805 [Bacteroidales bacterium]